MQTTVSRLEELLQGSIQILDHLKVGEAAEQQKLEQIKETLKQEYQSIGGLAGSQQNTEQCRSSIASIRKQVNDLGETLEQLQNKVFEEYKQQTNNSPQSFESLPLKEQKDQTEAYHDKIDYKSLEKLQDNLNKINAQLLDISGGLEHESLKTTTMAAATAGGGTDYDQDPAQSTLSP